MEVRFHVTFETNSIAPTVFPTFPYQSIGLSYDRITYSALLQAESALAALRALDLLWPGAQVSAIEQVTDRVFASGSFKPPVLGELPPPPPPSRRKNIFARTWAYLAGDGPLFKN